MNYEELVCFIKKTDIEFKFEDVIKVSKIIIEIDFNTILEKDYQIIKDFFSTASSLNLIPKEYDKQLKILIKKM